MQNAGNNIPFSKQVRYFASTKLEMEAACGTRKVSTFLCRKKVSKLLAKSFFLLSIGGNDLFQTKPTSPAEVAAIYANLMSNYSAAITV